MGSRSTWVAGVVGALVGTWCASPGVVLAQDGCFSLVGGGDAETDPVVDLPDQVRLSPGCRYALLPEGPYLEVPTRTVRFVELHADLAARTPDVTAETRERPRFLYATRQGAGRRRGAAVDDAPERLTLRLCSSVLLELAAAFEVLSGETLEVARTPASPGGPAPECGSRRLEIRAVDLAGGASAPAYRKGAGDRTLGVGEDSLSLPHGRWAFYAAAPDSPVGLRVGLVDSTVPTTPLRSLLSEAGAPSPEGTETTAAAAGEPLAEARWDGEGGALVLRPARGGGARTVLWAELRTATAAGLAWLGKRDADSDPKKIPGGLRFVPGGTGFQLSDAVVDEFMAARYGADAGRGMAPTAGDWKALLETLALCSVRSYRDAVTSEVPAARCAPLLALVDVDGAIAAQVARATAAAAGADEDGGEEGAPDLGADAALCIARGTARMTHRGADRVTPDGAPLCVPVRGDPDETVRPPLAIVGDELIPRGLGDPRLCVSVDGELVELPAPDDGDDDDGDGTPGRLVLDRPGLVEVRLGAGGASGCSSRQGLSLARIGVLDPEQQWHPVGLYTGGKRRGSVWRTLDHDELGVFGYRSSRQTLDTRLSSSPLVAAALDGVPGRVAHLPRHVPVFGGVRGDLPGTTQPTVVALVRRNGRCPAAPASELADDIPVDPDRLPPDATFFLVLAEHRGPDQPFHCLAKARFRVRSSRALVLAAPSEYLRLELGALGDPRAVVFVTSPQAAGVYLPVVWFRIGFLPWLGLEIDASLVGAGAFDTPALSRTGLGFSAAIDFGIPEILPRLLNVGAMVHVDGNWHPNDNPTASVFIGLNLATLVNLAGGL